MAFATRTRRAGMLALLATAVLSGCSTTIQQKVAAHSPTPRPPAIPAPLGLTGTGGPGTATLKWVSDYGTTNLMVFVVSRDGVPIGRVPSYDPEYTDTGVAPGTHTYSVALTDGAVTSVSLTTTVTVTPASLSDASLAGTWDIQTKVLSSYGFIKLPPQDYGWTFTPVCAGGAACPVVVTDMGQPAFKATLTPSGVNYTGTYRGPFHDRCGSATPSVTLQITVTIKTAQVVGTVWTAEELGGRIVQRGAQQYGCVATGATLAITGTR